MWIKAQDGELYNADTFGAYRTQVKDGIVTSLIGVSKNRGEDVVLLKFISLEDRDFIRIAKVRIEDALVRRLPLCDLSNICQLDYTTEEIKNEMKKARLAACPF